MGQDQMVLTHTFFENFPTFVCRTCEREEVNQIVADFCHIELRDVPNTVVKARVRFLSVSNPIAFEDPQYLSITNAQYIDTGPAASMQSAICSKECSVTGHVDTLVGSC